MSTSCVPFTERTAWPCGSTPQSGSIQTRSEVASWFDSLGLEHVAPRTLQVASLHQWLVQAFLKFVFVQAILIVARRCFYGVVSLIHRNRLKIS